MAELVVDENNRIITVDGKPKPHITEVLADMGLSKPYVGVDPWYAERGTAVHAACRLINEGTLDEESIAEEIKGYVAAYKQWLKDSKFIHECSEIPLFSELHNFCGTLDLVGSLPEIGRAVIDIKTSSSIDPAVEIQVGAQAILWKENYESSPLSGRFVLQLRSDGTYRLKDLAKIDPLLFLGALSLWNWKQSHKRKPKEVNAAIIKLSEIQSLTISEDEADFRAK